MMSANGRWWLVPLLGAFVLLSTERAWSQTIRSVRVAFGMSGPVQVASPPGDYERFFVVERVGRIKSFRNGAYVGVFLDIVSKVTCCGERGLLGLAFHPQYAANRKFYVSYTDTGGNSVTAEYLASPTNADLALPGSERILLTQVQPYSNHNGGQILFGPNDHYLYISLGDGGDAGDPGNRAQNLNTWLGKMLRIDVDGQDAGKQYRVPTDNPFYGPAAGLDEIWSWGLRNPWRFSFDRANGDLYIADVGQGAWEEVDYQPASSMGGENYGWRLKEGYACYNPSTNCDPTNSLKDPVHVYNHAGGRCSITGGFVYRGPAIPEMQGRYFFADYCSNQIWSFRIVSGAATDLQEHTAALAPGGGLNITGISSFGEDALGELYICDLAGGEVFKILRNPSLPDADGDGWPDLSDNCPADANPDQANLDGDGLGDVCDPDMDGDGLANGDDNCPRSANAGQENTDGDAVGDACDDCPNTVPGSPVNAAGCPPAIPGDLDRDGDVDLEDYARMQRCMRTNTTPQTDECVGTDLDGDNDVDSLDVGRFRNCMSGADLPGSPGC